MKNKTFKKSLSVFLSFLMVLTSLVFVVPEIAPKAEAADTYASYHVRMTVYLDSVGKGGNIAIKYYPVNADGSLDMDHPGTYQMISSLTKYYSDRTYTLATDHWGVENGYERMPGDTDAYNNHYGAVPGWPYEIVLTRAGSWGSYSYIQITNLEIGNGTTYKTVLSGGSWSTANGNKNISFNTTDTGIRPYMSGWTEPAASSVKTAMSDTTVNVPVTGSNKSSSLSVAFNDQYGVEWPVAPSYNLVTETGSYDATGRGCSILANGKSVQVQVASDAKQLFTGTYGYNVSTGRTRLKLRATSGSVTDEAIVTLQSPSYYANYVNIAGQTKITEFAGYHNASYTSKPSIVGNTATTYDGTNHTVYTWPSTTHSVTSDITIREVGTTNGHSYGNWSSDANNHQKNCSVCGYIYSEDHNFENWKTIGKTEHTKTCTTCGYVVTASHNWGAWVSDGNVQNGTHTRTCLDCGETESAVHTWNEGVVTTQPGCATPGVKTYTCTTDGCGATYTVAIAATGNHTYGDWYDVNGTAHRKDCTSTDCQAYVQENHIYDDNSWTYVDETNHEHACTVCKLEGSKVQHVHDSTWNWTVTTAPDCTTPGEETRYCSSCNKTETRAVDPAGHAWGGYTPNNDGTHTRKCQTSGCGVVEKVDCLKTSWNETPATCTTDAVRHYTCTDCGYTWDETLTGTMTGHYWLDYTVSDIFVENHTEYLAQAATCETSARYYNYCRDCGAASTVANYNQTAIIKGKETISENTLDVNMEFKGKSLGHAYTGAVVAKSDDTHAYQCVRFAACGSTGVGTTKGETEACSDNTPVVTTPTCTAGGYSTYECKCGNEWTADETDMIAHNWVSTIDNDDLEKYRATAANCVAAATYYKHCLACDALSEEKFTPAGFTALGHDYDADNDGNDDWVSNGVTDGEGTHTKTCTVCLAEDNFANRVVEENHTWGNGYYASADDMPTYDKDGTLTYDCQYCPAKKTETVSANVDATAATGSIGYQGGVWNEFLNLISFGNYINYDVTIEITAEDAETGIASTEYYISDKAMTQAELEALAADDWKAYDETAKPVVSKADSEAYVVYAKIKNGYGLVTYLSTDGFTFDTVAPVIEVSGSGTGDTYCETATFTVTEDNLGTLPSNAIQTIAPNGLVYQNANTTFTLDTTMGEWKVIVTDLAGNKTEKTVTLVAHDYAEYIPDEDVEPATPATCTDAATYYKKCANCSATNNETFSYGDALGHQDPTTYVVTEKADCENDGTKTAYCGRVNGDEVCNEVVGTQTIPARVHNMTDWVEVTPADCTTEGLKRKTCQNTEATDEYEACSYYEEEDIPATGHTWSEEVTDSVVSPADCENDAVYYLGCEDCDAVATEADSKEGTVVVTWTDVDSKTGHAWDEGAYASEADKPTCTEGGTLTYTCENENCPVGTYTEDVEATGHAWDEGAYASEADKPTCTETGTFTYTCGNANCPIGTYTETIAALGHTEKDAVVENYKGASCGVAGSYDMVVYCDVCGEVVSSTTETIPALDHILVKTNAVDAECEKEGNIDYWTCTTEGGCGKIYADENAETAITLEETVVKALGHKTQHVPAVPADCVTAGTIEHYKCTNGCGKYFTDVHATNELESIAGESALDHNFTGEWSYSLTTNKHQRKCIRCDVWTEQTDCTFGASCEATVNTDAIHTHKEVCECGNSRELSCTPVKGATHEDPTCGDENDYGWTDYSCAKCSNTWIGDKTYKLHKCVEKEIVKGDCVTKSYMVYECTNDGCDYEYTQALDYEATRHVGDAEAGTRVVVKNAKKATCDAEGYTGDIFCECGVLLKKGEAIPADETAHQWGTPAVQPGTCITDGYEVSYCDDCGEQKTVSTGKDPSVHMNVETGVEVKPTCTTTGYTGAEVCADCGTVVTPGKIVDALGHNIGPWEIITMPSKDGTTPGYAERRCLVCGGEKETREDFYYADVYYVVYHDYNGVRLTSPRNYIKGDYTLRPEKNPVRPEDNKYTYEFIGWDYTDAYLDCVVKSMTVVAQYAATEKSYTVKFYDANGNVIPVSTTGPVKYSQIVSIFDGAIPTKAPDAEYTYTFDGWEISCDSDTGVASVTPKFIKKAIEKEEQSGGFFAWLIALIKSFLAKLGIVL